MVMKMDKVLIKLYVPIIEQQFDILIPNNRKIYSVIKLLEKGINELSGGFYKPVNMPMLYEKTTGREYDINLSVKDNNIKNGTELVLI